MLKIIVVIVLMLIGNKALAVQDFEYIPGNKIKATISNSNLNRIEFGKIGIAEVIGDETKYKIITDSKAQNIFLLPKIPAHQTLELAVVNFSGNVADLALKVADIEGQVIRISMDRFYKNSSDSLSGNLSNNAPYSSITVLKEQEIAKMMRSMISDKEDKYYVTRVKRKIDLLRSMGLIVEQDRIYRFGQLIGARLKVTNKKAGKAVYLKESDFSGLFDFCLATTIEKTALPPRGNGFVWIVAREQANE